MKSFTPARFGAITILFFCCLAFVVFPRPAETRPAPISVQAKASTERVNGVVISLHGGGWMGDRDLADIRQKMRPFVKPALKLGWSVVHLSYSTGAAQALVDIHQTYLRVKQRFGRSVPVCLLGNSAGGHLALTYAGISAKRSDVRAPDCVVASSPPTDILAFRRQAAAKPRIRRENLYRFLEIGFRDSWQMHNLSPVRYVPRFKSKTLLFTVQGDPVVSPAQVVSFGAKLKRKKPKLHSRTVILNGGFLPFVHHRISPTGWKTYREQVRSLLRSA